MPIPKDLTEIRTPEEALAFFGEVSRNFSGELIGRIKDSRVEAAERDADPKLQAAWRAWMRYLTITGGAIPGADDSVIHIPA